MTDLSTEQAATPPMTVTDRLRRIFRAPILGTARALIRLGVHPNLITIVGFIISVIPAFFAAQGSFLIAGLIYMFSTSLDALDGTVARESNRVSRFGAMLDSTLDRYTEAALFSGIAYYMAHSSNELGVLLSFAALFGSVMVSYIRARSEGLTIDNKVGLLTRVERILLTIAGLLTGYVMLLLWVLTILTQVTVIQRLWRVYQATRVDGGE